MLTTHPSVPGMSTFRRTQRTPLEIPEGTELTKLLKAAERHGYQITVATDDAGIQVFNIVSWSDGPAYAAGREAGVGRGFWVLKHGGLIMSSALPPKFGNQHADALEGFDADGAADDDGGENELTLTVKVSGSHIQLVVLPDGKVLFFSKNSPLESNVWVRAAYAHLLPQLPKAFLDLLQANGYHAMFELCWTGDMGHGNRYNIEELGLGADGCPLQAFGFITGIAKCVKILDGNVVHGAITHLPTSQVAAICAECKVSVVPGVVVRSPAACAALNTKLTKDTDTMTHTSVAKALREEGAVTFGSFEDVNYRLGDRIEGIVIRKGDNRAKFKNPWYLGITLVARSAIECSLEPHLYLDLAHKHVEKWCRTPEGRVKMLARLLMLYTSHLEKEPVTKGLGAWIEHADTADLYSDDDIDAAKVVATFQKTYIRGVCTQADGAKITVVGTKNTVAGLCAGLQGLGLYVAYEGGGTKTSIAPPKDMPFVTVTTNPRMATSDGVHVFGTLGADEPAWRVRLFAERGFVTFNTMHELNAKLEAAGLIKQHDVGFIPPGVQAYLDRVDVQITAAVAHIRELMTTGKKVLLMAVGIPGSTKSTAMARIKSELEAGIGDDADGVMAVLSPDDHVDGEFNQTLVWKYHAKTQQKLLEAFSSYEVLAYDATNLKRGDLMVPWRIAQLYNANVYSFLVGDWLTNDESVAAVMWLNRRRGIGAVPEVKVMKMLNNARRDRGELEIDEWLRTFRPLDQSNDLRAADSGPSVFCSFQHGNPICVDPSIDFPATREAINVQIRDGNSKPHLTIVAPMEWKALAGNKAKKLKAGQSYVGRKRPLEDIKGQPVVVCLGEQRDGDNWVRFLVVDWPEANEWRASMGLPPKDFHYTMEFNVCDIHDVPKDASTKISDALY